MYIIHEMVNPSGFVICAALVPSITCAHKVKTLILNKRWYSQDKHNWFYIYKCGNKLLYKAVNYSGGHTSTDSPSWHAHRHIGRLQI